MNQCLVQQHQVGLRHKNDLTSNFFVIIGSQSLIQINVTHTLIQSSHSFVLCLGVVEVLPVELI